MDLSTFSDNIGWVVAIAGGLVTLGVLARRCWRWVRAVFKKGNLVADTLIGREPIYHPETGKELVPASPGIGTRMAKQEDQMLLLTTAVAKIADSHIRLEHVESRVESVEGRIESAEERIADLHAAQMERVITRAESAQAWAAVEAVAKATPDPDPDQLDS